MGGLKLQVFNNTIQMAECPNCITSGTIGLKAEFTFDSQWDTLTKIAVFQTGAIAKSVEIKDNEVVVPWEVLEKPYTRLYVGVYGVNADCTTAIPTLWTEVCVINSGADPEVDPSVDPTLPIWQDLLFRVEELEESGGGGSGGGKDGFSPIADVTQTADGAVITITDKKGTTTATVFNGEPGYTPKKGTDYWTPVDREQMVADVISVLPVYNGEVESV